MTPHSYAGFKIVEVRPYPKFTLSGSVSVSLKFRIEFNTWLREFFGEDYPIPKGQVFFDNNSNVVYMRPDDANQLQEATKC